MAGEPSPDPWYNETVRSETPRRGRPRSAAADAAILDATAQLLAEAGYQHLTMEAVAVRAGVAKTTVYRRWAAKPDLVLATMAHLTTDLVQADTGSLRSDLLGLLRGQLVRLTSEPYAATVRALQLAVAEKPELAQRAADGFLADRRREVDVIVDRALARGELQPGVDRELVFDLCVGALFMRVLIMRLPVTADLPEKLVDAVLLGYPNAPIR
jgi:AcrR family transcriptional regulator